jgi:two-component system, response regulator PdtaR
MTSLALYLQQSHDFGCKILKKLPVVLVVEDEPLILMDTAEELRMAGWVVLEARNADDALEQLNTHRNITALFTDIDMPGSMDGLRLAKEVKQLWNHIKIVITSGAQVPTKQRMPDGAVFVPKPYHINSIANAVSA